MADFPHPARPDPPHSGVLRTVYFLALAAAAFFTILTAVIGFYDPPGSDSITPPLSPGFEEGSGSLQEDSNDRADYSRNVSLIMGAVSAAVFAAALLGLGSRFNPLRSGLMLAGLIIFLTAMGFWSSSSDQAIGFLMALINLAVLLGSALYIEEGLPLTPREPPRRLAPADIAPQPRPPAPPAADFEPSAPVPPPAEPPPARTEAPPPMSDLPRE